MTNNIIIIMIMYKYTSASCCSDHLCFFLIMTIPNISKPMIASSTIAPTMKNILCCKILGGREGGREGDREGGKGWWEGEDGWRGSREGGRKRGRRGKTL